MLAPSQHMESHVLRFVQNGSLPMNDNVLALVDAANTSDASATAATQLACESNADLILAIDPRNEPFSELAARMSRLVDHAVCKGAHTSTILVDLEEPAGIVRAVRTHQVGMVVLEDGSNSQLEGSLRNADVPLFVFLIPETVASL
jgi:hypothetical protein